MIAQKMEPLYFSVEGEFIMDLARQRYWFENAQDHAMRLLGTLNGITYDQMMAILDGDAIVIGVAAHNGSQIKYIEKEDLRFKKKLAKHQKWQKEQARRDIRAKAEADKAADRNAILERFRGSRAEVRTGMDNLLKFYQDKPKPKHIDDPVDLGDFTVSKRLLDNYVTAFVEHHFMPVSITLLADSRVLMELHKELRNSVGLSGWWGDVDDEFDKALHDLGFKEIEKDKRTLERRRLIRAGVDPYTARAPE
jgi:hypothetical protein